MQNFTRDMKKKVEKVMTSQALDAYCRETGLRMAVMNGEHTDSLNQFVYLTHTKREGGLSMTSCIN